MCFYHSVAIKIEKVELLEVLGLKKDFEHPGGCEQDPFVVNSASNG